MANATRFTEVLEFHQVFGHPIALTPVVPEHQRLRLRLNLLLEEVAEVTNAVSGNSASVYSPMLDKVHSYLKHCIRLVREAEDYEFKEVDLANLAKELGDVNYVTNGFGIECGVNLDAVGAEIHRSNMTKLGEDGLPIYDENGKVVKGPNYEEADILSVIYPPVLAEPIEEPAEEPTA